MRGDVDEEPAFLSCEWTVRQHRRLRRRLQTPPELGQRRVELGRSDADSQVVRHPGHDLANSPRKPVGEGVQIRLVLLTELGEPLAGHRVRQCLVPLHAAGPRTVPAGMTCGPPSSARLTAPWMTTSDPNVQSPRTVRDFARSKDGAPSGNRCSNAPMVL